MLLPLLVIFSIAYSVFAVAFARREREQDGRADDVIGPLAKLVFAGGIPVLVAGVMSLLFFGIGGATTVQFNVGSPARMSAWSAWVGLWPVFLVLTAASGLGALIWLVCCAARKSMRRFILPAIFSLGLSILAFFTVATYFPSA